MKLDDLNTFHLDVFKEIGNIGAGNAATALANLIGKKIGMDVPQAGVVALEDLITLVGNEEDEIICIHQAVSGPAPCGIMFILAEKSAVYLADILLTNQSVADSQFDELEESLFLEVGNILSGSFLSAFSQVTNLVFNLSVPVLARDMLGAVLSSALLESGYYADKVLVVETRFFDATRSIKSHFFILPELEALDKILNGLGINI